MGAWTALPPVFSRAARRAGRSVVAAELILGVGGGMGEERLTTVEATCRLCWHLGLGEGMTTAQAAELIGYSTNGAWRLLCKISRFWPITQTDEGVWELVVLNEPRN